MLPCFLFRKSITRQRKGNFNIVNILTLSFVKADDWRFGGGVPIGCLVCVVLVGDVTWGLPGQGRYRGSSKHIWW